MKIKLKRSELQTNNDIWNAVLAAYGQYDFPTEDEKMNDFFILFNYYCELESGGHESLFNWFSEHIEKMGIQTYSIRLSKVLEKVGANEYAEIEKRYIEQLWKLFLAVEKSRIEDPHYESLVAEFCNHIEQADSEYSKLGENLSERLSQYANAIYTEVIEIVED
ncbi:hypothetical protein MKY37_22275 [Psychrobacillus sp. FSL K6-2836]|uniref:DMP19 family protein n=1 Tax=Psychrobacillus sp. FSL K6-2836 TaxID=2921548 RepID=UPI0030F6383F